MIGQTISHYKIIEKLGEGGMGIVYKALDTNLDRVVALKFMPHNITPDESEQARFLQEAKAASALNHPNVCTIYGIHEADGQKFIEMEFVDGVTLRRKIPINTLNETIAYAVQIADALHEAHQKGIVHRDIKADNIMINGKNQIKVMDFGLAKLKGSFKLTKTTSTVGTLAYMAPEQIQGSDVDARSDIFSFGVVMYEMLTGHLPFRSEHEAALMYSIINDEPEPIQKYREDLPPVLMNLIQRALEKDPNDRYQSINEVVIELRRLQKQSTKVSRSSLPSMPAQPVALEPRLGSSSISPVIEEKKSKKGIIIGASSVAIVLVAAALWLLVFRPPSQETLNPNMTFRMLQIPYREIGFPSLSRDGGWIAFAAHTSNKPFDIYLMNANSGEPRQITTDSNGFMQTVDLSPDGSQIVYDRADKGFTKPEIAIVSSLGGFSKRIVNLGFSPHWRPDGQRIGYVLVAHWGSTSGTSEFRSVKPNGTDDRLEFADTLFEGDFTWAPDGRSICYSRRVPEGHFEIFIRDLESKKERQLTSLKKNSFYPVWTQNEKIIFTSNLSGNENLWMMPSSGGTPVQITRGTGPDYCPVVSADSKRLLFVQQQNIGHVWVGSLPGGTSQQLTFQDAQLSAPTFSPDGKNILYVESNQSSSVTTSSLNVLQIGGNVKNQLISEEMNIHSPKWSPDGKWVAFAAHPDTIAHDSSKMYLIDAENPGTPRQIGSGFPERWLSNTSILTSYRVGRLIRYIDGRTTTRFFSDSLLAEPILDGKYVLYTNYFYSKNPGVWLEPAPGAGMPPSEPRQLVKSLSNYQYDPVAKILYYVNPQNELHSVSLPDGKDQRIRGSFAELSINNPFSISADGRQITYLDSKQVSKLMLIDNLR